MFLNQAMNVLTMSGLDIPINNFVKELLKRGKLDDIISYPDVVKQMSHGLAHLIEDENFDNVIAYGPLATPFAANVAEYLDKRLLILRLGSLVGEPAGENSIVIYFKDGDFKIIPEQMNIVGYYYIFSRYRSKKAVFYLE